MEIKIREARQSDVPAITEILRELGWFAHMTAESPAATEAHVARQLALCQADKSHLVFVAEAAGEEVMGYISELFIKDSARGHGIGSRLLETVESEAIRRGCTRLDLLNMRQRESYQREFYTKQGWEERPQAANFVKYLGSNK
ncbi:MAG: GNAT family N-acetyltransferase [Anaerolineales bacterium]